MRAVVLSLISVICVLTSFDASAVTRSRETDREYDLFENTRRLASLDDLKEFSEGFTCPQKCTSMEADAVAICGSFEGVSDCLSAGCVWSCE